MSINKQQRQLRNRRRYKKINIIFNSVSIIDYLQNRSTLNMQQLVLMNQGY